MTDSCSSLSTDGTDGDIVMEAMETDYIQWRKRVNSHCIIYKYKDENGNDAAIWETYHTEILATQRKATIDFHQKTKDTDKVRELALQYRAAQQKKHDALNEKRAIAAMLDEPMELPTTGNVTWREFLPVWLSAYIKLKNRKKCRSKCFGTFYFLQKYKNRRTSTEYMVGGNLWK